VEPNKRWGEALLLHLTPTNQANFEVGWPPTTDIDPWPANENSYAEAAPGISARQLYLIAGWRERSMAGPWVTGDVKNFV
jgi:hypothetical protein